MTYVASAAFDLFSLIVGLIAVLVLPVAGAIVAHCIASALEADDELTPSEEAELAAMTASYWEDWP